MADHKKTPDILGDLLGKVKEPEEKPAAQPPTGIPVSQPAIKPARQKREPIRKTAPKKQPVEASGDKVKATFYLSAEIVDALEDGWSRLRKITPKKLRGQVSKSLMVEQALQAALEELESKGERSLLARKASKE